MITGKCVWSRFPVMYAFGHTRMETDISAINQNLLTQTTLIISAR